MHADELTVEIQTVRDLVSHQFPQWARLPITGFASQGTVNALFRTFARSGRGGGLHAHDPGCRPASSTARNSSMYRVSAECGPRFASFRVSLLMS
jgi:aminoglycoside phosphotransferase (APT) family kinase protein